MNYEQKYKEALERAKQIQSTPYTAHWDKMKELVEHIFPELKESEGEMVRKALIKYYSFGKAGGIHALDNITPKQIVAWLEKQGEQKPVEERQYTRKIIDTTTNEVIGYQTDDGLFTPKTRPVWSEEDEEMLENAISSINHDSVIEGLKSRGISYSIDSSLHLMENLIAWLKSIRPQNRWKPSDEQMKALRRMKAAIAGEGEIYEPLNSLYEDLKKL